MPNVFEFLGLPANHRPKNKVVQLVKHYNEVPASKKSYPLIAQVKKDGVFAMLVICNGFFGVFGRTGEMLTSCGEVIEDAYESQIGDGVYIAELLSRELCSLEELSGVVNPNRVNELNEYQVEIAKNLYLAFHDYLSIDEFIKGSSKYGYLDRYKSLLEALAMTQLSQDILPFTTILDDEAKDKFTEACLAAKEEGAVYKQPNESWVAGHKGYKAMKEVGEVSYDLLCTRVEEGEGKYKGLVANMYFRWKDGTEIKAMPGKGHTHKSCREMWLDQSLAVGKVWKVKGLCNSSKGKVRLPKVEEERFDKTTGDF